MAFQKKKGKKKNGCNADRQMKQMQQNDNNC